MDRNERRQDQLAKITGGLEGIVDRLEEMARMPLSRDTLTIPERIALVQAYAKMLRVEVLETSSASKARVLADFEKMLAMPCPGLETATPSQKMRLAKAEMRLAEVKRGKNGRIQ
jgi:hypothetical protein